MILPSGTTQVTQTSTVPIVTGTVLNPLGSVAPSGQMLAGAIAANTASFGNSFQASGDTSGDGSWDGDDDDDLCQC